MKIVINILFATACLSCFAQNKHSIGIYGGPFSGYRTTNSTAEFKTSEKSSIGNEFGIISTIKINKKMNLNSGLGLSNWSYKNSTFYSKDVLSDFKFQNLDISLGLGYDLGKNKSYPILGFEATYHHLIYAKYTNTSSINHVLENTNTSFVSASLIAGYSIFLNNSIQFIPQIVYSRAISSMSLGGYSDYPYNFSLRLGFNFYLE